MTKLYSLLVAMITGSVLFAQTMIPLPNHNTTYTGNSRGMWFTAPTNFVITGLRVPTDQGTGPQTIEIVRLTAAPPFYATTTNAFTSLGRWVNVPGTGQISVNIPVNSGDIIGVMGVRSSGGSSQTSYGTNNYASNIGGFPITLSRFGMQYNLITTPIQNAWQEAGGSIGRVEVYYTLAVGPNDAGVASIDSPAAFCAGAHNIVTTIENYGINQIDTVTVNWSINGTVQTPYLHTSLLDTANGLGPKTAQITLGSHPFTAGKVDTISVWTSMPNNVADTINSNDTMTVYRQPALSGTFTLGGGTANYPTFASAVADLATFGVCGPVTFLVNPGTYNEQISIPNINGTSSFNTVTFVGVSHQTATLTYAPTNTTNNYTVRFDGCDHVTFDSLVLQSTGTTYRYVLQYQNSSDWNTVSNCIVEQTNAVTSTSTLQTLVYSNGSLDNYNRFLDNHFDGGSYGFYWRGTSTTGLKKGTEWRNNTFRNQYRYGLYLYYGDSVIFDNNDLQYTANYGGTTYGFYAYYQDNRFDVTNNKIIGDTSNFGLGNWNYAVGLFNCDGTSAQRQLIANNMISLPDTVYTGTAYGLNLSNNGYQDFVHNSIFVGAQGTNARTVYATGGGGGSFQNNILEMYGPGYGFYLNSGFTFTAVDYNSYWAPNGNVGYFSGTAQTSMTNWRTASGFDANGFNVDPLFVSNHDLHTCEDTLESAGTPTGLVTVDIDGENRGAMPDIGADEFATLSGSFLGPDTAICPGDSVMLGVPGLTGTFAWSTGDSTATIYASAAQTYFLTASSTCGAGSDNVVVTHKPLPVASFTQNVSFFSVQFNSTATNATSYWWDFGDGNNSTQQNPLHIYAFPGGTFTVTHVAYNDCGNDTATFDVTANEFTSVDENSFAAGVHIYPNPAKGEFNISMNLMQNQSADIEVVSVTGATVYRKTVTGKQGTNVVNVKAEFAKGAYFVRLKSEQATVVKKLIIE